MDRPYQNLLQIISCLSVNDRATEGRIECALRQEGIVIGHLHIILRLAVENGILRKCRDRYFLTHPCYLANNGEEDDSDVETIMQGLLDKMTRDVCKVVRRFSEEYQNTKENILNFFQTLGYRKRKMEEFLSNLADNGFLMWLGQRLKVTRQCLDLLRCSEERTNIDMAADAYMEMLRKKLYREICNIVHYFQRTDSATQELILGIFQNKNFEKPYIENILNQLIESGLLQRTGIRLLSTEACENLLSQSAEDDCNEIDDRDGEEFSEAEDDENDRTLTMEEDQEDDEHDRTLTMEEDQEDEEHDRTLTMEEDEDDEDDSSTVVDEDDVCSGAEEEWKERTRLTLLRRSLCYVIQRFEENAQATLDNIMSFFVNLSLDRNDIQRLLSDLVREGFIKQDGCRLRSTNLCQEILNRREGSALGPQVQQAISSQGSPHIQHMDAAFKIRGMNLNGGAGEPALARHSSQKKRNLDDYDAYIQPVKKRKHSR